MTTSHRDCGDWRCSAGRQCLGHCAASQAARPACTCVASIIGQHGPYCDGACQGGGCAASGHDDEEAERRYAVRWSTWLGALLGCWVVFLGIGFGAVLAWAWQAGMPGLVGQ